MRAEEFSARLTALRLGKNVSAREMSLSLGQAPGYLNNIENGRALPSMAAFFDICEYLGVTEAEFFRQDNEAPARLREAVALLSRLNARQLEHMTALLADILAD